MDNEQHYEPDLSPYLHWVCTMPDPTPSLAKNEAVTSAELVALGTRMAEMEGAVVSMRNIWVLGRARLPTWSVAMMEKV